MAAGATQTRHSAEPLSAAPLPAPQIQRELARTGRRIKWVDLLSWIAIWMTGTLAVLLAATIVDHWLLDLGRAGRFAAWLTLALGSVWVLVRQMLPLILRRINPVFAARSIEEGAPGLKNSLVNFLTVGRAEPALVDALAEQAAADLQRVDPELAVDRSRLIRTFLVLAVVVALAGVYTIRAPKSPFDTALRVLAPWSDRSRPSRVKIAVAPGDAEVVRGGTVVIRAELEGRLREEESVTALLTSADGQLQQQPVDLQQIGDSNVWQATLPASGGLQQPCDYQVTAGDGRSPIYHLTLLPAPTIDVREARYQPPAYTGLPERTSIDPDLLGVDGAWVNLVAEANEPIQTALIELGPRPGGRPAATVAMRVEGRQARGRFQLELDADGRPMYGAYQVTFVNLRGDECLDPVLHRIEVQADLKPVVEVLDPLTPIVEVPEDGQVEFKVRGLDPDFGLQSLNWVMQPSAGPPQIIERSYDARRGPVVESFRVIPSEQKWKAGLEIVCHAEATDNRPRVGGRERAASKSDAYRVRITARNPSAGDKPEQKPEENPEEKPEEKPEGKPESEPSSQQKGGKSQDQGQPGGQGDSKQGKQGGGDADGNSGQTSSDGKQDDPQAGAGESGGDPQGGGGKPQQQGEKPAQPGASGQPKAGEGSGTEAGTGAASGDNTQERGGSTGAPNNASQPKPGGQSGQQGPETPPEPLHDGDVFDRIRERLEGGEGADQKPQGGSDQRAAGDGNRASDSLPAEDAAGQKGSPSPGVDERGTPAGDAESGAQPTQLPPQPGDSKTGEQPTGRQGEKPGGEGLERDLGQGQARQAEPGRGGNPQGPTEAKPEEADPNREKGPMSDPGQGDNGDSSETNTKGGQKTGAPASQEANRDTDKSRTPKQGTSDDEAESPPSPSQDKNQRDIDGGEGGDRSGAGEKGGGQGGKREGNDSAGSHSSADEGAGASPESGQGETAQRAGNKQTGQTPTGATGEASGSGSERRDAPSGEGAGGKPAAERQATPQGATGGAESSRGEGGAPTGGGLPSERGDQPAAQRDASGPPPPLTPRDKANLDYASQATDLVLNYLSEQQRAPDPKLLEDLNWTAEDLEKFVQRWKAMKAAGQHSEAARRELQDAMLSLGLRPAATSTRTTSGGAGAGAIDSGDRSEPPPAYRGKFNAFKRGRR